ncbi:MAG: hypothetical protein RIT02_2883 [Planctomycetota bacterium]
MVQQDDEPSAFRGWEGRSRARVKARIAVLSLGIRNAHYRSPPLDCRCRCTADNSGSIVHSWMRCGGLQSNQR